MREIQLSKGKTAIVDDADYDWLSQWKWRYGFKGYPKAHIWNDERTKRRTIEMHRLIMGEPAGLQVDHINGDPLDNRRENLRLATNAQNQMNRRKTNGTSQFKGVSFYSGKWHAYIERDGIKRKLGTFTNEIDAAQVYDKNAKELFGAFARLNFPANK